MVRKKISPWLIVFLIILVGVVLNGLGVLNLSELFSSSGPGASSFGGSSGGPI